MNADRLLAHYDRIADAPDAVPRLRRLILDLAVRGRLVEQDPNDEPASELLKRITVEKARLVKEKKISKQVPFKPPDPSEISFNLPDSWDWCPSTYPSYIVSDKGKKVQTKDIVKTGEFPVVDQGKVLIRGYYNDANKVIRVKEPIVLFGDHTREMKLIDFDFVVGADGVKLLQPVSLHTPYYFLALQWLPLESRGYGRHFKLLKASFIPLPPLAEQHRIVAKVDELMALCDRLETARADREVTRDRLAAASLARLDAPDPETFQDHARFALDALPALTARPDQIKQLRRTILNLAVRGKLVPQDPNDEPASELLKWIAAEKARLVKAGKLRVKKSLSSLTARTNLEIPTGWRLAYLGEIIKLSNGFAFKSADFQSHGIPVIRIGDLHAGEVDLSNAVCVSEKIAESVEQETWIPVDALLIAMSGATTGKVAFNRTGERLLLNQRVGRIETFLIDVSFVRIFFETIVAKNLEISFGTAIPNLSAKQINETVIPIPPLAEQHRIVARVDKLMALCDRLEASLATRDQTRHLLLDALLHETLAA